MARAGAHLIRGVLVGGRTVLHTQDGEQEMEDILRGASAHRVGNTMTTAGRRKDTTASAGMTRAEWQWSNGGQVGLGT